jgi:predicted nucleic acid-binding protein
MILVADTSPLNYLIQIDCIEVMERLYSQVIIPQAVYRELSAPETPQNVRTWLLAQPAWVEVRPLVGSRDPTLEYLGPGEQEAIQLAEHLRADAVLIDDKKGRAEAAKRNLPVIGTLGVLAAAAEKGWLELPVVISRLRQTNFHASPQILKILLERFKV